MDDVITVLEEVRVLVIVGDEWVIEIPGEHRTIEVPHHAAGQ